MVFIILLALSAFAVAGSAAFFSVYGLAQIFSASFVAVVIMGASLEYGKLVAASYLYRYWKATPFLIKTYLFTAILVLMVITSLGIFGFLTAAYQKDSIGLKQQQEQISLYESQRESYHERLAGINEEIAKPDANYVSKRIELIGKFEDEKTNIIKNIESIDSKLLELRSEILQTEAKIGPIIYVAEVLGENPDKATFWFVLIIIGVFDPLAVSLTLATNIALRQRQLEKEKKVVDSRIAESVKHVMEHTEQTLEHAIDEAINVTPDVAPSVDVPDPTEVFKDEILQIKKLIMDSDKSGDITKLNAAFDSLNSELKKQNVRNKLNTILKK